jgi:alanine racemase
MAEPIARLEIDLAALSHNYDVLVREAAGAEVAPVVKADGYGLGAAEIARRLWIDGARSFFVARLPEGEALRAALGAGRAATIYVLDGLTPGTGPRLLAAGLTPALTTLGQIAEASGFAGTLGRTLPVALHVDTGMNRQGLTVETARAVAQSLDRLRGLGIQLVMSHLGSAAEPDDPRNARQLAAFRDVRALFPQARASLAASAGIFLGPDYCFDLVRPGVSLFGGGPLERPDPRLNAVVTLSAPILDIRTVQAGEQLGYGSSVTLDRPTRIALVAAGYADGLLRSGKAGGHAWFAGAARRLLIVNMDILAMELGDAEAQPGQLVELLGPNAPIDDYATSAGTVAHELLTRISGRAVRRYVGAPKVATV